MKITSAEFVRGIRGTEPIILDPRPKIAFIGRSNVGKSSAINALAGRKDLVKSSSLPGKTREVNFFLINKEVFFVDLPGYGFAKIRDKERDKLRKLILWLFTESGVAFRKVCQIIDASVGLTDLDREMLGILLENGHDILVIANKADRLKRNDLAKASSALRAALPPGTPFVLFSAKEKTGVKEVLKEIL